MASERYPVGTKVQVKNNGLGSQFRSESERVGEFSGTVIATNGPDYTGIPEVCVQSESGERRVILVGDLELSPEKTARFQPGETVVHADGRRFRFVGVNPEDTTRILVTRPGDGRMVSWRLGECQKDTHSEPTAAEYAQAFRAIQAHIPNGRNAAREGA